MATCVVAWADLPGNRAAVRRVKVLQIYVVRGPIQTRAWEDRDGQKRYSTEIKAPDHSTC